MGSQAILNVTKGVFLFNILLLPCNVANRQEKDKRGKEKPSNTCFTWTSERWYGGLEKDIKTGLEEFVTDLEKGNDRIWNILGYSDERDGAENDS